MLMKKILLTMFMAVTTMVAMAKTYTDNLIVSLNGESFEPQETAIIVEQNANGTYKLALNNFVLGSGDEGLPVGNIVLDGIKTTESNGIKAFQTNQDIYITAGEGNAEDWMGPMLNEEFGAFPVSLTGKMDAEKLYCTITISIEGIGEINVVFGDEKAVTSIENIAVENNETVIYDITGRRVNEITNAGIYIVNGKKVFVK